jgi:hypothetical protein
VKSYEELIEERKDKIEHFSVDDSRLKENMQRKWLTKHGKSYLIDFDDKERQELKKYFDSLDDDGSGTRV